MISVSPPLNNSVINPPQLFSVGQQSSSSSQSTPRYNRLFNSKESNSNRKWLSSPVIHVPLPLNDSVIDPPQLSSVRQKSSRYSHNTTYEFQASSIPGWDSPDPSNTMPPPYANNGSRNIYECMVDVSKLTQSQRQQHAVMLLQNYHKLCNTNDSSSIFLSPTPIPNIELLSQTTISSLDSGSFGRNLYGVNIQQPTTSEVSDIDIVMTYNEDLDLTPPQDILNVFAAAYLLSRSSSDSNQYRRAYLKAKLICSSILSSGECPDSCSR